MILDAAHAHVHVHVHVHQDSATTPTDRLATELVHGGWAGLLKEPILLGLTLRLGARLRSRWTSSCLS